MKVQTGRFGELEVHDEDILTFPEGILGFPESRRYVLVDPSKGGTFRWLQSVDEGHLAFVVADPSPFFKEYKVKARTEELRSIQLSDVSEGIVAVIMTISRERQEVTANLQGPLVINKTNRLAKQLVLSEPGITTRHRLHAGTV
jgi:flagellar assembly factor FliW